MSLCRANDPDRAPRFHRAALEFGATGYISDLDDSPDLAPLSNDLCEIKDRISSLTPRDFHMIFTHGAGGEYTRHIRHEQVHRAVSEMIEADMLRGKLISLAYEDCGGKCVPRPSQDAQELIELSPDVFAVKQMIVREIYGFGKGSFEFESAGLVEAFMTEGMSDVLECLKSTWEACNGCGK